MSSVEEIVNEQTISRAFEKIKDISRNDILLSKGSIEEEYYSMINVSSDDKTFNRLIKPLLIESSENLEQLLPGSGSLLLNLLKGDKVNLNKILKTASVLNPAILKKIRMQLKMQWSKDLFSDILTNIEPNSRIFIHETNALKSSVEVSQHPSFKINFDEDYFLGRSLWKRSEARVYILDGRIEKISEILHLLNKCAEDKVPTVLFCYGLSNEVKNVIQQNLIKKNIDLFPVVIEQELENINLFRDISIVTEQKVISAKLGDVLSIEIKKEGRLVKNFNIQKNFIKMEKNCSDKSIQSHILFLKKMKKKSKTPEKAELFARRISEIADNKLNVYMSRYQSTNNNEVRKLHYALSILSKDSIIFDTNRMSPFRYIDLLTLTNVLRKFYSLNKMKYNIKTGILLEEK